MRDSHGCSVSWNSRVEISGFQKSRFVFIEKLIRIEAQPVMLNIVLSLHLAIVAPSF